MENSYEELLRSELFYLPVQPNGKGYQNTVKELLTKFMTAVNQLDDGPLGIVELPNITGSFVKRIQDQFTGGLLESVDLYYSGHPAEAYEQLTNTLEKQEKGFESILKFGIYEREEPFFRMRKHPSNFPLERKEMFHLPFEKRGLVATQRYSIPGFPCLYLGRTIYGCWEEMNRPDIHAFQVVRLQNTVSIRYLDLTRPAFGEDILTRDIYYYFMTWPLIACCSVKVGSYADPFKPEYILAQLLLQWVRRRRKVDGIRFSSTHIDAHRTGSVGDFSNLVLPVKENRETGFCRSLARMFRMTTSISWQLYEHALGGQSFVGGFTEGNGRIERLELIPGRALPYSYSVLGKLEQYLDGMLAEPLTALCQEEG